MARPWGRGQQEPGVRLWPWLPLGQTLWTLWTLWSNWDARRAVSVGLYTGVQKGDGCLQGMGASRGGGWGRTVHISGPQFPLPPQSCSGRSSPALLKPWVRVSSRGGCRHRQRSLPGRRECGGGGGGVCLCDAAWSQKGTGLAARMGRGSIGHRWTVVRAQTLRPSCCSLYSPPWAPDCLLICETGTRPRHGRCVLRCV